MAMSASASEQQTRVWLHGASDDVQVQEAHGDVFFFAGDERKFPFTTIVNRDTDFDHQSRLDRADVHRLNLGVAKATFLQRFLCEGGDAVPPGYAALDTWLPHPVYARMYWLSVLGPSAETLRAAAPLLREAYELQMQRSARSRGGAKDEGASA